MKKFTSILKGNLLSITIAGLVAVTSMYAVLSPSRTVTAASAPVSINLINYGWHNTSIDTSIVSANPVFVVDNSPAGPWKGIADIKSFTSAGIKYFEYLDGGYEGTVKQAIPNDLYSNLNYITAAAQAGASGIFLDEVSSHPTADSLSYLQQIAAKARSLGLLIVFNVGVDSWSDSLMDYCDYINSSETWRNAPLTASQSKWASRTWLLTYGVYDATTAANLTKAAWNKGILAHYACTSYEQIPVWFNDYVNQIKESITVTPPEIITGNPTALTTSGATLNGSLTSLGSSSTVTVSFEWGLTSSYGNTTATQTMTSENAFTATLNGLTAGTTYHFRAKATGSTTVYGLDGTFTTAAPVIPVTGKATTVTTSGATLNGSLTSLGSSSTVTVSFEWGLTSSYGNTTAAQTMTSANAFTATLNGLTAGTTYHFRAKATGSTTVYGLDGTFTTAAPVIPVTGNTTGTVVGTPVASGGTNEYCFSLKVTSTTVPGISVGQLVWCAATTTDFPNLRTAGTTLTGNLDRSLGWWVLENDGAAPMSIPPTPVTGNTTGTIVGVPVASGGTNEYSFFLKVTSTTVPGISVGKLVWCAATTTDFPNLLTAGATLTGNLDRSRGWWVLNK